MYYGGYGYYGMDATYILVFIGMILTLAASAHVKSVFHKYSRMPAMSGITGADAARRILDSMGLYEVQVQHTAGDLTDHYDPSSRILRLSDSTYGSTSVAALGVAAHECGHAQQHQVGYTPLSIRSALVPAANIGSRLGMPIIILGVFLSMNEVLINVGIWVFALAVLFQIVTLPVEFDASHRALGLLENTGVLGSMENKAARKVLTAAALTYVAAAAASILQLLRLILLFGGGRKRR